MRSSVSAAARPGARTAAPRYIVIRRRFSISERLPQREVELEGVDFLSRASGRWLSRAQRLIGRHLQKIVQSSVKSKKAWRIRAEAQIQPDGAYRCPDTNPEADAMHHIIKVLQVLLTESKADRRYIRVDVPHVVEEYAADTLPEQREPQFRGVKEQCAASNREACQRIARARLIVWKGAVAGSTSGIESLRQRDHRQASPALYVSKLERPGEHNLLSDGIVVRVSEQQPAERGFRAKSPPGVAQVHGVKNPAAGVDWIIPPVLDKGAADQSDANRLVQQTDCLRRDLQRILVQTHVTKCVSVL